MKQPSRTVLAHSARFGRPAQSYAEHIDNVTSRAVANVEQVEQVATDPDQHRAFVRTVKYAARYHDLGKIVGPNQEVLCGARTGKLPINHVDAGTQHLLGHDHQESAVLVYSHHIGLPSFPVEFAKGSPFRDPATKAQTDEGLLKWVQTHDQQTGTQLQKTKPYKTAWTGLTRRLALSCLVDADHSDTATHYGRERLSVPPRQWRKRLGALNAYVHSLGKGDDIKRNTLRTTLYRACRDAKPNRFAYVDSPVGSGKTTAVMAYLLRMAAEKDLHHVFCVLPFTNIIQQSVEVYRRALCSEGEDPEHVVAAHHHQVDFASAQLRDLATLWNAPITVTTAVQFFETLGSHHPARLRKLHELAGSAIFIDEAHAALPSWLWPQVWKWLSELVEHWGCFIVLASGSLAKFWEHERFADEEVTPLVSDNLRERSERAERARVNYRRQVEPVDCGELVRLVESKPGPRLVILNTVRSAAVVADEMRSTGHDVLHLSTSLTPKDRTPILKQIRSRLADRDDRDWSLVATSCVEAGVDLSFRTGFRESASTASLVQVGGRVNRHTEYEHAEIWDFRTLDGRLTQQPVFELSRSVLGSLWDEGRVGRLSPTDLASEATRRELMGGYATRADEIAHAERVCDYPLVDRLCRVIDSDTVLVVIDRRVVTDLERGVRVSPNRLLNGSVQIWASKRSTFPIEPIGNETELFKWVGQYDADFLGYMAAALG